MKEYIEPEIKIRAIDFRDVIVTSEYGAEVTGTGVNYNDPTAGETTPGGENDLDGDE